ncbi:MAG: hypothetical protein PHV53_11380, partial [Fermentimonas sp.]|nr:hypothetical protein [Fermentimonas sp.]
RLDEMLKGIYYELLKERREFYAFFHFLGMSRSPAGIEDAIHQRFRSQICDHANLKNIMYVSR